MCFWELFFCSRGWTEMSTKDSKWLYGKNIPIYYGDFYIASIWLTLSGLQNVYNQQTQ